MHTASNTQLKRFAWLVLGLNLFTTVVTAVSPWMMDFRDRARFSEFLPPEEMEALLKMKNQQLIPLLLIPCALSVAGAACGVGLIKHHQWARDGWIVLSIMWLIWAGVQFYETSGDWQNALGPMFRVCFAIISIWFLNQDTIKATFHLRVAPETQGRRR